MPTAKDLEFLETEIGLIRGQLTEMLAHLDALQAQVDSAKACLASQHPGDCLPSNNPLWKEALVLS